MAKKMKRPSGSRSKSTPRKKAKKASRSAKRTSASKRASSGARKAPKAAAPRANGPTEVSPGFTANDAAASIKWYCDVLGFSVKERWENEGVLMGATVAYGRATVNISQDDWKLGRDRKKGQGVRMFITTADDINTYAKAITSRGGTLDGEPTDDWGFRAFSVTDPDGYKITFMRPLK